MKSIKEKSEELSTAFRKEQGDVGYSEQLSYKLGVEAGANYVLEQIEKLINNQNWCAFPKQSHKELKELFEQLKGNQ